MFDLATAKLGPRARDSEMPLDLIIVRPPVASIGSATMPLQYMRGEDGRDA